MKTNKRQTLKKISIATLALAIVLTLALHTATHNTARAAEVTLGSYAALQAETASTTSTNNVVKLGENMPGATSTLIIGRDLTLDLNGKTLTIAPSSSMDNGININTGVTLTIKDSLGGGTLTVNASSGSGDAGINTTLGTLIIESGTVNATGGEGGAGIGGGSEGSGGSLAMNGNGVVFASTVSDTGTTNKTSGILFVGDNATGTFYGTSITITDDVTIPSGYTLPIGTGQTLTIPAGKTLANNGTVTNNGTIIPANGSTVTISGTVGGSNKITGANANAPTEANKTANSITLNAATLLAATGQAVEYARNTTSAAPTSDWQDGLTFSGLSPNTTYYFFARSKENTNFSAGAASSGISIATPTPPPTPVTFTATQTGGASGTADSTGIVITFSQSVTGLTAADITIADDTGAAVKGTLSGSGATYTIALTSVTAQGDVTVSVDDFGTFDVTTAPQTVAVYKDTGDDPDDPDPPSEIEHPTISPPDEWTGGGDAVWTIDADENYFQRLRLMPDNDVVHPANYTVTEGSTIIRLHRSYLETLSNGEYTFRAVFETGYAETTLAVAVAGADDDPTPPPSRTSTTPQTGAPSNIILWAILSLASATGGTATIITLTRRNKKTQQ